MNNIGLRTAYLIESPLVGFHSSGDDLFARPPETYAFFHLGAAVSPQTFLDDAPQLLYALSHIRTDGAPEDDWPRL